MKNYLVVQHTYSEFLGLIESQLEKRDIGFSYYRPVVGQELPGSAGQFDGLFLLAGAYPACDAEHYPYIQDEVNLVKIFQTARRPVIGIGMGAQVVAMSAGGEAIAEPSHTAKFVTAHKTAAGEGNALAETLDGEEVLVMYNGDVTLPEGLEPLLVDDDGHWLAIKTDDITYGLLFRPEMKPGMLEDIIMEGGHNPPEHIGELLAEARMKWDGMQKITDKIVVALVTETDLMRARHKMPVFSLKLEVDET